MVFLKCDNIKLYYFINFCFKDAIKPNFYIYYANYFFLKKKPSIYHVFKPGTREGINTQAYISCFPVTRQRLSIGSTIRQKAGWFHCDGD